MALVKCPEEACGKLVSTKAEVCPHCGCPLDSRDLSTEGINPADQGRAQAVRSSKRLMAATNSLIGRDPLPGENILFIRNGRTGSGATLNAPSTVVLTPSRLICSNLCWNWESFELSSSDIAASVFSLGTVYDENTTKECIQIDRPGVPRRSRIILPEDALQELLGLIKGLACSQQAEPVPAADRPRE